jgi:GNAT superfamily N-acetyltransferase
VKKSAIAVKPATRERWADLIAVFGEHGAYSGCWCMYWRVKRAEFDTMGPNGRRAGMRRMVARAQPPGVLFYDTSGEGAPVPFGWCPLGPREDFPVLQRSYVVRPVDDVPVWSMVCFYLREEYQGRGLYRHLVTLAADYARGQGATHVEAYPREGQYAGMPAYMGIADVLRSLGFREIARRKPDRPVMRLEL